jgi:16S rRNA C967 or C1407 C5-methylase (RsmB/RsmF family)
MGTNWEEIGALYEKRNALQREVHELQAQIEDLLGNPLAAEFYRGMAKDEPDAYVRLRAKEFLRDNEMYAGLTQIERLAVQDYASRLLTEHAGASPEVKAANDLGAILTGVEAR